MALLEEQVQQVQGFRRCMSMWVMNKVLLSLKPVENIHWPHWGQDVAHGLCLALKHCHLKKKEGKKRDKEKLLMDYRFLLLFFPLYLLVNVLMSL